MKIWLLLALTSCALSKKDSSQDTNNRLSRLEDGYRKLSIQLMMQQFYVEEQTRANGDSGLKRIRSGRHGLRPYQSASYVASSVAAIHDHANNDRTIGMGEIVAVLNGVEFRTRHNDYRLRMKSRTSREYGAVEDVDFPDVPPEVRQRASVRDQIEEMRLWFKAWKEQDYSVRDYRRYFKPVLCYLEGSWTLSDPDSIDEPFDSDRHQLDARSWYELQQKIRFTSYSGGKDGSENLGYLPTTVIKLINGTEPIIAQWNYDILCHPLKDDLPLKMLQPVDDLKSRMAMGAVSMDRYLKSRAARFKVTDQRPGASTNWDLLDELMAQVPGRDNYPGRLNDTVFGDISLPYSRDSSLPQNAAYYHRVYRVKSAGAMGLKIRHRGFSDGNLFVAQTTQPKVVSLSVQSCPDQGEEACPSWEQRWSYAIPLEIIYMTPLSKWNPYKIRHRGGANTRTGKLIYGDRKTKKRDGRSQATAYDGTNSKVYYRTPNELFADEYDTDPADTTEPSVFVLDAGGTARRVRASGHRVFLPEMPGVGILRQRYPVMPIHGEGGAVWKELEAIKDILLDPDKYQQMFRGAVPRKAKTVEFVTDPANAKYGKHVHYFEISFEDLQILDQGGVVSDVITDISYGHTHSLTLMKLGKERYLIKSCDSQAKCPDGHSQRVHKVEN